MHHRHHYTRRNPTDDFMSVRGITGDASDALWAASGLAGTALMADNYVTPFLLKFIPNSNTIIQKGVGFVSALGVAKVIEWAVGKISRSGAKLVGLGGLAYSGGKLISIPFSSFNITAALPTSIAGLQLPAGSAAASSANSPVGATAGVLPVGAATATVGQATAGYKSGMTKTGASTANSAVQSTVVTAVQNPSQFIGF